MKLIVAFAVGLLCCIFVDGKSFEIRNYIPQYSDEREEMMDINQLGDDYPTTTSSPMTYPTTKYQTTAYPTTRYPTTTEYWPRESTTTPPTTYWPPTTTGAPITNCDIANIEVHHYPGPCRATITCENNSVFTVDGCLNTLTFVSHFTPNIPLS